MKYYRPLSSVLLLIIVLFSCGKNNNVTKPVRKDVVQAVYASGKLFPKDHYMVLSKFPGYIQQVHVNAGDIVKAGQILLTIRNETGKLNTGSALNQLNLAA